MNDIKMKNDVERLTDTKGAKEITAQKHTVFHEMQRPGSRYFDASFPKGFCLTPDSRKRYYLVSELVAWVRNKAAVRNNGGSNDA